MAIYSIDYSNKLVKRLNALQSQLIAKECQASNYRYFINETPVIPEYNFAETQKMLWDISEAIITIKHQIREANMKNTVASGKTADEAILELAFLNNTLGKLRSMASASPKTTANAMNGSNGSEIRIANYDIAEANTEYNRVYNRIMQLQDELNSFNILHQIKVDIDVEKLLETSLV